MDIEAQAAMGAQGSEADTTPLTRQKLRELIQMLTRAAEILQSSVRLDDDGEISDAQKAKVDLAIIRAKLELGLEMLGVRTRPADDEATRKGEKEEENSPRTWLSPHQGKLHVGRKLIWMPFED